MEIELASKKYVSQLSKMMLKCLIDPNNKFPKKMINKFREHAKEKNLIEEFENPNIIAFISKNGKRITGFIVGYTNKAKKSAMIHYITGNKIEKKELLQNFIKECKQKKINKIITDTFEFMDNNDFFKSNNFLLIKREKITPNLEMLWYELNVN